jgi:protein-S-isoprenylcysteine O-methyltransferase Ste14
LGFTESDPAMKNLSRSSVIFLAVILVFGVPLVLAAGSFDYWNGFLFLGIFSLGSFAVSVTNPELTEKRSRGNEEDKSQTAMKGLMTLCAAAIPIVSGMDYLHRWSAEPVIPVILSAIGMAGGFFLMYLVMKENRFATSVVEIQNGQTVIASGPYSVVRHPMYLAFTIVFLSSPLVLGSFFALIPAAAIPLLLTLRIRREEAVMRSGFAAYEAYARIVKYRLIPFVW